MDISNEYIRELVEGEGPFVFHIGIGSKKRGGTKHKIPAFIISMHIRDKELLIMIKKALGL